MGRVTHFLCFRSIILKDLTEILSIAGVQEPYHIIESTFKPAGRAGQLCLTIDKPAGVTIGDLAKLTRRLGKDVELANQLGVAELRVDISSPGVTADLLQKWQYERHKGRNLKILLISDEPDELKYVKGVLEGMDESGISVLTAGESRIIQWDTIKKSNVQLDW